MRAAIAVLVLGAFAIGLLPGAGEAFGHAAAAFTDPAGYIALALSRPVPHHAAPVLHTGWTASGVALDLLSVVVALALALVAVRAPGIAPAVRAPVRPAASAMAGLRRLHSGHVGDYVAWLAVGVAGIAALTGLPLR
jgi:multicomponent Na+:H+ antiporter subunit D